ncbi:Sortilin- receptor, partial [Xenoophorus captivus]
TYFRISSLLVGHNYTFSVQASCLLGGQLCGEPALLLYNPQTGSSDASRSENHSRDMASVVVPVLFLLLVIVGGGLVALYIRHRRLQNNFTAFANSHYNSRLGSAIFSSGDELGNFTGFCMYPIKSRMGINIPFTPHPPCSLYTLLNFLSSPLAVPEHQGTEISYGNLPP